MAGTLTKLCKSFGQAPSRAVNFAAPAAVSHKNCEYIFSHYSGPPATQSCVESSIIAPLLSFYDNH